jgi:hypothetical protein
MQQIPNDLWSFLMSFEPHERFALSATFIVFGLLAVVLIIGIIAWMLYRIDKNRIDDALKRELLDRGLSAEEIATVIHAAPAKAGRFEKLMYSMRRKRQ